MNCTERLEDLAVGGGAGASPEPLHVGYQARAEASIPSDAEQSRLIDRDYPKISEPTVSRTQYA